ncbi:MAG: hypothetical protein ACLR4W_13970 [Oscillospiraceae bacterium]
MKKYMGNYTNEAAKALKGSERIICRVTDDGAIYVTNGFIAYKMTPGVCLHRPARDLLRGR